MCALVKSMVRFKRVLFRSTDYQSAFELLDDMENNQYCLAFVTHCLQLRMKKIFRHTVSELLQQRRDGANQKLWFKPMIRSIFAVYKAERSLAVQSRGAEASDLRGVSRRQRLALAGGTIVRTRRTSSKKLAAKNRAEVTEASKGKEQ